MNEYYIAEPQTGRIIVYYCPFCGGSTPKSRRASLFAHVCQKEETRILALFIGIRTVADVMARFGLPDEDREFAARGRTPGHNGQPERGEVFRGLVYKGLSPVAEIMFEVGSGGSARGTWTQKCIGRMPG